MINHSFFLNILKFAATLASGLGKRKKLFILIYHRVLDKPDYMRPGEVDKNIFTWQMDLLSRFFNVLPFHEALEKWETQTLPSRAVCITFDDGYSDNFLNALPILQKFGLKACFFIASGYLNGGRMWNDTVIESIRNMREASLDLSAIDLGQYDVSNPDEKNRSAERIIKSIKHLSPSTRADHAAFIAAKSTNLPDNLMMTSEQVLQLNQSGMEIGGHTVSHPILAKLDEEAAWREISDNKAFLEGLLSGPVSYFAYPNGKPDQDYHQQQTSLVSKAGYQAAVSTRWGVCDQSSDKWQLPRFTPWDKSPIKFMIRMIGIYTKVSL